MKDYVFHLDLCTLAYQLHAQALLWPLDPYAEQMKFEQPDRDFGRSREVFLDALRDLINDESATLSGLGVRGVPPLHGDSPRWGTNAKLDPVLYDYANISPHRPGFARQNRESEQVIVYEAPAKITTPINHVFMVSRSQTPVGTAEYDVTDLTRNAGTAGDRLYCFEGATGLDSQGRGAWGPMGFVLMRHDPPNTTIYDVHIVFRGSRSGQLRNKKSLVGRGNADWVTDVHFGGPGRRLGGAPGIYYEKTPEISPHPTAIGFARAMKATFPAVIECLNAIDRQSPTTPPRNIYVAGHSLGGALASCFVSALRAGNGDLLDRPAPPNTTIDPRDPNHSWPWADAQVFAFGAPPAGALPYNVMFDAICDHSINFMIFNDLVPMSRLMHHGRTIVNFTPLSPENAHSPKHIRRAAQRYMKKYKKVVKDDLSPWLEKQLPSQAFGKFVKTMKNGTQTSLSSTNSSINGLKIYLKVMQRALDKDDFPSPGDQQAIRQLKGGIDTAIQLLEGSGGSPPFKSDPSQPRTLFNLLKLLSALNGNQPDRELQRMFQAWVWLAYAEAMQDWRAIAPFVREMNQDQGGWVKEA